jgi:hypothetical protein
MSTGHKELSLLASGNQRKHQAMSKVGTIYEVHYFYAGLAALGLYQGPVEDSKVDELIRQELIRFNRQRSQRYNLPRRDDLFQDTPRAILFELKAFGLVELVNHNLAPTATANPGQALDKSWQLTEEGWHLYQLLADPASSEQLRESFTRLMFRTFPEFSQFLKALRVEGRIHLTGIPMISYREFEQFSAEELEEAVARAVSLTVELMQPHFKFDEGVYHSLRQELKTNLQVKLAKGKSLGPVMESELALFFLSYFFKGLFQNEIDYKTVRARGVYLGIANYWREGSYRRTLELLYPTAFLSNLLESVLEDEWQILKIGQEEYLYIYHPRWPDFARPFTAALCQEYLELPRPTGYVQIADLRDRVCYQMSLADHLFDTFLKLAIAASQKGELAIRIYLDNSHDQAQPLLKRAPLELREGAFNLIRIESFK